MKCLALILMVWLTVVTTASAAFTNIFVASGSQTNLPIPTSGTGGSGNSSDFTYSTINVSGFPTGALVTSIVLTLNINHTSDSDLDIRLNAPDGINFTFLVRPFGTFGQNFSNTTLDDTAAVSITNSTAPYTGTFRPQFPLSSFSGLVPNGTWTLQIDDTFSGDIGTLLGWSMTVVAAYPQLTISDTAALEGNSGTTNSSFLVKLSPVSPLTVTVKYATTNGTALAGTDYTTANSTLTFGPGTNLAIINIPVKGNTTPEANKTFFVNLSSPTNATLVNSQARGLIMNDDPATTNTFSAGAGQTNLALPPFGTGGTGAAAQDTTVSAINVTNVASDRAIAKVRVTVSLNHTDDGDLVGQLVAPDGTTVLLNNHDGEGIVNFSGTIFDDQATTPISLATSSFSGGFIPETPLSQFIGKTPNGTWTLQMTDTRSSDSGTLNTWSLTFITVQVPTASISYSSGNAVISWPTNFLGYSPAFRDAVTSGPWTSSGVSPIISGTNYTATVPIPNALRFFHLQNP